MSASTAAVLESTSTSSSDANTVIQTAAGFNNDVHGVVLACFDSCLRCYNVMTTERYCITREDEAAWRKCVYCEEFTCFDCLACCQFCDRRACLSCVYACNVCRKRHCLGCLKQCKACGFEVCPHCVDTCRPCSIMVCRGCIRQCGDCWKKFCPLGPVHLRKCVDSECVTQLCLACRYASGRCSECSSRASDTMSETRENDSQAAKRAKTS
jgi:hypothetical protein